MRLVHEDLNTAFTQVIYYDEETELYYELLRGTANRESLEVYVGKDIYNDVFDYIDVNGRAIPMAMAVYECTVSNNCDIDENKTWNEIVEQLDSYIMRSAL